jgi:hypothetical protein
MILRRLDFSHYVRDFNQLSDAPADAVVQNADVADWMATNVPFFDCPDEQFEKIYYFRWWTYRKHIRRSPHGIVLTEFITPVSHAGPYNTISCAFGHHLAEGRWMKDQRPLDENIHFWFRSGPNGGAAEHFHKYSSWAAAALYDRYLVTGDERFLIDLLDDLVSDYERWEAERQRPDGLFWQYDVRDGMEESISGDRHAKHIRPTINSYMAANARAIAQIARLAERTEVAERFDAKAKALCAKIIDLLWDSKAKFYKVRFEGGGLSDAREAIGFIPWTFGLAPLEHAEAWRQFTDPQGFWAPRGLTTAERRHPAFRTHGVGTCEWDGAVWPFATSQTLTGLARLLHGAPQPYVAKNDFFNAMRIFASAHEADGRPYIGEYHDEVNGNWLITGPKAVRSRDYNHSTFCDLVISGLVGLMPRADEEIEIEALVPPSEWDWFCLDNVSYHGRKLTVVWDRTGKRYGRGTGFTLFVDGVQIAHSDDLGILRGVVSSRPAD